MQRFGNIETYHTPNKLRQGFFLLFSWFSTLYYVFMSWKELNTTWFLQGSIMFFYLSATQLLACSQT